MLQQSSKQLTDRGALVERSNSSSDKSLIVFIVTQRGTGSLIDCLRLWDPMCPIPSNCSDLSLPFFVNVLLSDIGEMKVAKQGST